MLSDARKMSSAEELLWMKDWIDHIYYRVGATRLNWITDNLERLVRGSDEMRMIPQFDIKSREHVKYVKEMQEHIFFEARRCEACICIKCAGVEVKSIGTSLMQCNILRLRPCHRPPSLCLLAAAGWLAGTAVVVMGLTGWLGGCCKEWLSDRNLDIASSEFEIALHRYYNSILTFEYGRNSSWDDFSILSGVILRAWVRWPLSKSRFSFLGEFEIAVNQDYNSIRMR